MAGLVRTSLLAVWLTVSGIIAFPSATAAQDYIKLNGWYEVSFIKFKPDHAGRAFEIIHDHLQEVDKKVNRQAIPFDFRTGEWDHIVYFPILLNEEGYDTIPPEEEWWAAFAEQEGGQDAADKLFAEFLDSIAQSKTEIARLVLGSEPGQ
jgi:hypothetical protein